MRYSEIGKRIGAILKDLRKERGLKQKDIADKLEITDKAYSTYETGYSLPPLEKIFFLCEFYHVTPNFILGFDNDMPLYMCLDLARACGLQCRDRNKGYVECKIDDDFDKMTANLDYDVFIRLINRAKKEANEAFMREFTEDFALFMVRYCLNNKETIVKHISLESKPKTRWEKLMVNAMEEADKAVASKYKTEDGDE